MGGANNYGTIFEVAAGTTSVITLASFSGGLGGFSPLGPMTFLADGNLYGTTTSGGTLNRGTVFEFNLTTHAITTVASFVGGTGGAFPTTGVVGDGAHTLFGTTYGASQQNSTIFELDTTTGQLQTLASLPLGTRADTSVARDPLTGNVAIDNGNVFATTLTGGGSSQGTIISAKVGGSSSLTAHTVVVLGKNNGNRPIGDLLLVNTGNGTQSLVGTASGGGPFGAGTVYQATLVENGSGANITETANVTLLAAFNTENRGGGRPVGQLVMVDGSGNPTNVLANSTLYGVTTVGGGGDGNGAAYKIVDPKVETTGATQTAAVIHLTTGSFKMQTGTHPSGGLALLADGTLVGTTLKGGAFKDGTLFFLPATVPAPQTDKLVFTTLPTNTVAGTTLGGTTDAPAGSVVVKIEDANGRVLTSDTSAVTLSVATGFGTFTPVTVNAVAGIATFSNITLDQAGIYTLLASDATPGLYGQSSEITITPAAATQLAIQSQPILGVTTRPLMPPIVVAVEDAFGNVVTKDSSSVTLALASGPAAPSGTLTIKAKNGIAMFNQVSLKTVGTYTLTATDANLTLATTGNITIGLPATQMSITSVPTTGIDGISFSVSVTLQDANGNTAATDQSSVTIALGTRPSGGTLRGPVIAPVVNGVATFTPETLYGAGTYTLRFIDGGLPGVQSANITISPAP